MLYIEITPDTYYAATHSRSAREARSAAREVINSCAGTQYHLAEPRPLAWGYVERAGDALPGRNGRLIAEHGAELVIECLAAAEGSEAVSDLDDFLRSVRA